jgi:preprotein translocase subunit YajC
VSAYIFILVLLALMWFLLIRPQRKRQLQAQQLVDSISVGKEIVTAGGLYGTVTAIEDDEVHVEIAEGVEVRVAKRAVAGVVSEDEPEDDDEPEEEPEEDETPEGDKPEEERPATLP